MEPTKENIIFTTMDSPVGDLLLVGGRDALTHLIFQGGKKARSPAPEWRREPDTFHQARAQLRAYFAGELRTFDLPLAPSGTPFQLLVWEELRAIPYGRTRSYGEMAKRIGRPAASRAVGAANGANPLAILVPCHRVIGGNGSLTGFGGGLPAKQTLLDLEQANGPTVQLALLKSG